jgi:flagellin-like protein
MQKGVKRKMKKETKGLSPVIATVLLIVIVVVIALIVFLWIKGMTQEAITKFGDRNIEMVCEDVEFEASYTSMTGLYITNYGNVPIFGMDIKEIGDGSHTTVDLRENPRWPETGLNTGGIFADEEMTIDANEIVLIPVLIGESDSGRKTYVCNENQYGVRLSV